MCCYRPSALLLGVVSPILTLIASAGQLVQYCGERRDDSIFPLLGRQQNCYTKLEMRKKQINDTKLPCPLYKSIMPTPPPPNKADSLTPFYSQDHLDTTHVQQNIRAAHTKTANRVVWISTSINSIHYRSLHDSPASVSGCSS